jgi:hypothetical protein
VGLLDTVTEALAASTSTTGRNDRESAGAYWCHGCSERVLDLEAEAGAGAEGEAGAGAEGEAGAGAEGEAAPDCPSCGEAMTFERSTDSTGCAC